MERVPDRADYRLSQYRDAVSSSPWKVVYRSCNACLQVPQDPSAKEISDISKRKKRNKTQREVASSFRAESFQQKV